MIISKIARDEAEASGFGQLVIEIDEPTRGEVAEGCGIVVLVDFVFIIVVVG